MKERLREGLIVKEEMGVKSQRGFYKWGPGG